MVLSVHRQHIRNQEREPLVSDSSMTEGSMHAFADDVVLRTLVAPCQGQLL